MLTVTGAGAPIVASGARAQPPVITRSSASRIKPMMPPMGRYFRKP